MTNYRFILICHVNDFWEFKDLKIQNIKCLEITLCRYQASFHSLLPKRKIAEEQEYKTIRLYDKQTNNTQKKATIA